MKLKYLGTGAYEGVPGIFCDCPACRYAKKAGGKNIRTRSQAIVDGKLLLDFPADTYMHMLHEGLDLYDIHTCLITHRHSDHLYQKDIMARGKAYSHYQGKPLTVYASKASYEDIMDAMRRYGLEQEGCVIAVQIQELMKPFETEGYHITPLPANHAENADPVFYIIEKDGKRLLYAHDTGYFPTESWVYLEEKKMYFDCVSLDATLFYQEGSGEAAHMAVRDCVKVYDRLQKSGFGG